MTAMRGTNLRPTAQPASALLSRSNSLTPRAAAAGARPGPRAARALRTPRASRVRARGRGPRGRSPCARPGASSRRASVRSAPRRASAPPRHRAAVDRSGGASWESRTQSSRPSAVLRAFGPELGLLAPPARELWLALLPDREERRRDEDRRVRTRGDPDEQREGEVLQRRPAE